MPVLPISGSACTPYIRECLYSLYQGVPVLPIPGSACTPYIRECLYSLYQGVPVLPKSGSTCTPYIRECLYSLYWFDPLQMANKQPTKRKLLSQLKLTLAASKQHNNGWSLLALKQLPACFKSFTKVYPNSRAEHHKPMNTLEIYQLYKSGPPKTQFFNSNFNLP